VVAHAHTTGPTGRPDRTSLPTVAVVLAGGTGSRVGLDLPKQLLKVAGKSILGHTLELFQSSADVDQIVLLMTAGWLDEARAIVEGAHLDKVVLVAEGGRSRNESTTIAVAAVESAGRPPHRR